MLMAPADFVTMDTVGIKDAIQLSYSCLSHLIELLGQT